MISALYIKCSIHSSLLAGNLQASPKHPHQGSLRLALWSMNILIIPSLNSLLAGIPACITCKLSSRLMSTNQISSF